MAFNQALTANTATSQLFDVSFGKITGVIGDFIIVDFTSITNYNVIDSPYSTIECINFLTFSGTYTITLPLITPSMKGHVFNFIVGDPSINQNHVATQFAPSGSNLLDGLNSAKMLYGLNGTSVQYSWGIYQTGSLFIGPIQIICDGVQYISSLPAQM
jgi:hypothetical protein